MVHNSGRSAVENGVNGEYEKMEKSLAAMEEQSTLVSRYLDQLFIEFCQANIE
jgi:hypothetical protein